MSDDFYPFVSHGQSTTEKGLTAAVFTSEQEQNVYRAATVGGFTFSDGDRVQRSFVLPAVFPPSSGTTSYKIDASIDWRDRFVWIRLAIAPGQVAWPGAAPDALEQADSIHMYTGAGEALEQASMPSYAKGIGASDWWFVVGEDDGALYLEINDGFPGDAIAFSGSAEATFQLGEHSSPEVLDVPGVSGTDPISANALNHLQDRSMMIQADGEDVDALPMGPILTGSPPVARTWTNKNGATVRQKIGGSLSRFACFYFEEGAKTVIDDAHDWRDRIINVTWALDADEIIPGGASDADLNSETAAEGCFYSSTGGASDSALNTFTNASCRIFADPETGALVAYNGTAGDLFGVAFIFATHKTGYQWQ